MAFSSFIICSNTALVIELWLTKKKNTQNRIYMHSVLRIHTFDQTRSTKQRGRRFKTDSVLFSTFVSFHRFRIFKNLMLNLHVKHSAFVYLSSLRLSRLDEIIVTEQILNIKYTVVLLSFFSLFTNFIIWHRTTVLIVCTTIGVRFLSNHNVFFSCIFNCIESHKNTQAYVARNELIC